jgi:hypothetical protein
MADSWLVEKYKIPLAAIQQRYDFPHGRELSWGSRPRKPRKLGAFSQDTSDPSAGDFVPNLLTMLLGHLVSREPIHDNPDLRIIH